jgi:hypothetical protein
LWYSCALGTLWKEVLTFGTARGEDNKSNGVKMIRLSFNFERDMFMDKSREVMDT